MTHPTGERKSRNPLAWIAAALTSLFLGVFFAGAANWAEHATHRPPNAAETQELLAGAFPPGRLIVEHVAPDSFQVFRKPVTLQRVVANPNAYQFAYTEAGWTNASPDALDTVAANLASAGWEVSASFGLGPAAAVTATRDGTFVIVSQSESRGLAVILRREPPEAFGAAVVFGLVGLALVWPTVAHARRRLNIQKVSGAFSTVVWGLGVLVGCVVLAIVSLILLVNLAEGANPQTTALWNLVGLPWLLPGYLVALLMMLLAVWLARRSSRVPVDYGYLVGLVPTEPTIVDTQSVGGATPAVESPAMIRS